MPYSTTVKLLAALLVLYAAYVAWWAIAASTPLWLAASVIGFITATGLFARKRWAQYLWHALAACVTLAWVVELARVVQSGWPYQDTVSSVISLVPGLFLLVICGGGSFVVARHYRMGSNTALNADAPRTRAG
jgi:hypothetical protein